MKTRLKLWGSVCAAAFVLLAVIAPIAGGSGGQTKSTKSYVFKLSVGMPEDMWTPAQVRSKHPTSGEVMLAGSMGGAMSMGGSSRHVEVQILKRPSSKVIATARPTITLVDLDLKGAMSVKVPFAVMRGVDEGASDTHYGNNVDLVGGHRYRVTVGLGGEHAVFQMTAPKG